MKSQEEIINKMRELKNTREEEIENQIKYLDSDHQKYFKVLNVNYIGNLEIKDKEDKSKKAIFLLTEQTIDKNDNIVIIEKYYTEDFKFLAGDNKSDGIHQFMLNKELTDDPDLLDSLNSLRGEKESEIDLQEVERNELEEIAKALGIDEKDIKNMSQMDLAQEIEDKQEDENKDNREDKEENSKEQELDEEETKKIVNPKQEMKINTKVDNKKTLGQALGLNPSEYTKIAIVYSEKLNEIDKKDGNTNNTRYSFVAIRKDGTAKTINDKLEIDHISGNNSYRDAIKIDADKTARKDDKTRSRYKIKGKEEYLSVENGQYGELKAYYGKGKTREKNETVETQLETTNVKRTPIELRNLQASYKGNRNTDKMAEEANQHFEKYKEKKVGIKSVDGDEKTKEHIHDEERTIYNDDRSRFYRNRK